MASGDLGAPAYRKFDVEAWMPGLGRYGEVLVSPTLCGWGTIRVKLSYTYTSYPVHNRYQVHQIVPTTKAAD